MRLVRLKELLKEAGEAYIEHHASLGVEVKDFDVNAVTKSILEKSNWPVPVIRCAECTGTPTAAAEIGNAMICLPCLSRIHSRLLSL